MWISESYFGQRLGRSEMGVEVGFTDASSAYSARLPARIADGLASRTLTVRMPRAYCTQVSSVAVSLRVPKGLSPSRNDVPSIIDARPYLDLETDRNVRKAGWRIAENGALIRIEGPA